MTQESLQKVLEDAVERLKKDSEILHQIVHGSGEIATSGGIVKSTAKTIAEIKERIETSLSEMGVIREALEEAVSEAEGYSDDAEVWAKKSERLAASLNLPQNLTERAGQLLVVKADGSGYETIQSKAHIHINWRGAYDAAVRYEKDDAVSYQGSSFVAKSNVHSIAPGSGQYWDIMAAGSGEPLTHRGDLLIHDGNKSARLPCGKETQVLQMAGGMPTWGSPLSDISRRVWKLSKVNGFGSCNTRVYLMADGTIKACGYGGNHANGNPAAEDTWLPSRVAAEDSEVRFTEVF